MTREQEADRVDDLIVKLEGCLAGEATNVALTALTFIIADFAVRLYPIGGRSDLADQFNSNLRELIANIDGKAGGNPSIERH